MKIKSIVIHEILKKAKETGASILESNALLDINNEIFIDIVQSLDNSFHKKTLRRAKFSEKGFKKRLSDFKSYDMLTVSKVLVEDLKNTISAISPAKGGFLIFSEYKKNDDFLAIFLVRNIKGTALKFGSAGALSSKIAEYLDVEHFAMGLKINLTKIIENSEERYLTLVNGNTDISKYFEEWIGLDDPKEETKDADALLEIAEKIHLPNGILNSDALKKKIYDYVKGTQSKIVNLRNLSEYLYEDPEVILKYCEDSEIDIDGEFKLKGANLSKFFKLSVKAGDIELTAPLENFGKLIKVVGNKVIITSEDLAQQINQNT